MNVIRKTSCGLVVIEVDRQGFVLAHPSEAYFSLPEKRLVADLTPHYPATNAIQSVEQGLRARTCDPADCGL